MGEIVYEKSLTATLRYLAEVDNYSTHIDCPYSKEKPFEISFTKTTPDEIEMKVVDSFLDIEVSAVSQNGHDPEWIYGGDFVSQDPIVDNQCQIEDIAELKALLDELEGEYQVDIPEEKASRLDRMIFNTKLRISQSLVTYCIKEIREKSEIK